MRKRITPFAIITIVFCLASLSPAQEVKNDGLPNFSQVNKNLYRGGQPAETGLQRLKQLGVKTIINLRDDDKRATREEKDARAVGFNYFNIPLSSFGRPADATVDQILKLINTPENQPVFVHCERGSDRTGTIIAIYRIEFEDWTSEKAKAEAKHFGLGFWQIGMKDYIHDRYNRRSRTVGSR